MAQSMRFAVCGLHMSGGALNHQMVTAGATLRGAVRTAGDYSLFAVSDAATGAGCKPALVRRPGATRGVARVAIEVWDVPVERLGGLFAASVGAIIASGGAVPLAYGAVVLDDGETVAGFVGEGWAGDKEACAKVGLSSEDITSYGGWREWRTEKGLPV